MFKAVFTVLCLASVAPILCLAQGYSYEPAVVSLHGTLVQKRGEEPNGKMITFTALKLDRPITVQGTPGDDMDVTESDIRELHIIAVDRKVEAQIRRLKGRRVLITGGLMHSHTGHHHTTVLVLPKSVQSES